jgi:ribonucleoside-diphosphate reductase alpha chain
MENYEEIKEKLNNGICPECGAKIAHAEGCVICHCCGFSMCG